MCLVAIAVDCHPNYPLIILGNRDEFHARPSAPADWWTDAPDVFGGRDQVARGSWLAANRAGQFAVVTNQPAKALPAGSQLSRGDLVREFITGELDPEPFLERVLTQAGDYAGFFLVLGDSSASYLLREPPFDGEPLRVLSRGVHVITNSADHDIWPKARFLKDEVEKILKDENLDAHALMELLNRRDEVPSGDTIQGPSYQSTPFVMGKHYGTRASTILSIDAEQHCRCLERSFDAAGHCSGESGTEFEISPRLAS